MAAALAIVGVIAQIGTMIGQLNDQAELLEKMEQRLEDLTNVKWLIKQAREICIGIDKQLIAYSNQVYNYFIQIINGTLFTPSLVKELLNKVYIVIGIVIFFKVVVISIKYMVNPEMFLDDKLGAQTLVKRFIIGSIIIIMIPTIFGVARRLQSAIISDHVIEKMVLNDQQYREIINNRDPGKRVSVMIFRGFFNWNSGIEPESFPNLYSNFEQIDKYLSVDSLSEDKINTKEGDTFVFNYVPVISTMAIAAFLIMLIKFSLEVLLRAFKLVLMQLMAPFVITSYMLDPSKEEQMKKWTNTTLSIYLLMFVRVLTIWVGVLVCYFLQNGVPTASGEVSLINVAINGQSGTDNLLKTLIILALYAFLKDLPKILSNITGFDFQENETITGIVNQGVNVAKGFAMAKVGTKYAKQQIGEQKELLGKQKWYAGASSVGSGLTSVGSYAASNGGFKASGSFKGFAKGFANDSKAMTTLSSGIGMNISSMQGGYASVTQSVSQATSTAFGQSILSPISNASSIQGSAPRYTATTSSLTGTPSYTSDSGSSGGDNVNEPKHDNDQSEPTVNNNNTFTAGDVENILHNFESNNIDGTTTFDLSANVNSNQDLSTFNNNNAKPTVIDQLAQKVHEQLPNKNTIEVNEVKNSIVSEIQKLSDSGEILDRSKISTDKISQILSNVQTSLSQNKK